MPELSRGHSGSARSLLLTVLGEFVLPTGPVWTATMVDCFAALGVEERSTRQALARLATDGWIMAERDGRRTRWALTASGHTLLTEGAARIYSFGAQATSWQGRWLVLTVSVPEPNRKTRHLVRTRLAWAGFGSPAPGVWVSANPGREAEAKQILADLGLVEGLFSFIGPFASIGSPTELVAKAWDLDEVAARYRLFIDAVTATDPCSPADFLAAQIQLVHDWRRMPFGDPQLPCDLLPPDWIGREAVHLFHTRHAAWAGPAAAEWRRLAKPR